jgi:catechol 2,3-dioxygenase-like lactoylglutathione lyase family enzyme
MPKLDGILETAIHTEDMVRARAFYEGVLGLEPIYSDNRLSAYAVAGRDVLLVFRKGTTAQTVVLSSGTIPGHSGDGVLHVAFAIGKDELDLWEARLASRGVAVWIAPAPIACQNIRPALFNRAVLAVPVHAAIAVIHHGAPRRGVRLSRLQTNKAHSCNSNDGDENRAH